MNAFILALSPVFSLILVGFALKRLRFLPDSGWNSLEKLTYYVLFPALLVSKIANQNINQVNWSALLSVIVITLLLASTVIILWHQLFKSESAATFTSIFQGGVRFNTYIMLAVTGTLLGAEALATGAIVIGFMILLINMLCITVFLIWTGSQKTIKGFTRELMLNPLVIACLVGWTINIAELGLPTIVNDTLIILSQAALPLGLLVVGNALRLEAIHGHIRPIIISSVIQFGMKPVTVFALAQAFELDKMTSTVLMIAFMVPTAPSGYILARQLGGDTDTMASIITAQTLLAFILMPLTGLLALH